MRFNSIFNFYQIHSSQLHSVNFLFNEAVVKQPYLLGNRQKLFYQLCNTGMYNMYINVQPVQSTTCRKWRKRTEKCNKKLKKVLKSVNAVWQLKAMIGICRPHEL